MSYKHVGRIKNNKRKVIVAYRTVPGEPENCIVITTENLMADEHDSLMKLVESDSGQSANEFADAMARTQLPDGRIMLSGFHNTGKMVKVATKDVEMTPDRQTVILLSELNQMIAEQKGVSIEDLYKPDGVKNAPNKGVNQENSVNTVENAGDVLTDEQIAAKMRNDAKRLSEEAKRLREEAEKLHPTTKRRTSRAKTQNSANTETKVSAKSKKGTVENNI